MSPTLLESYYNSKNPEKRIWYYNPSNNYVLFEIKTFINFTNKIQRSVQILHVFDADEFAY